MQDRDVYTQLLGLRSPWQVVEVTLSMEERSVQVFVATNEIAGGRTRFTYGQRTQTAG